MSIAFATMIPASLVDARPQAHQHNLDRRHLHHGAGHHESSTQATGNQPIHLMALVANRPSLFSLRACPGVPGLKWHDLQLNL